VQRGRRNRVPAASADDDEDEDEDDALAGDPKQRSKSGTGTAVSTLGELPPARVGRRSRYTKDSEESPTPSVSGSDEPTPQPMV
jgi:hypothetical protein